MIPSIKTSPQKSTKHIKRKYSVASYQTQQDNSDDTQLFVQPSEKKDISGDLASVSEVGKITDQKITKGGTDEDKEQDEAKSRDIENCSKNREEDGKSNGAGTAETEDNRSKLKRTVTLKEYRHELMIEHGFGPSEVQPQGSNKVEIENKPAHKRKWSLWSLLTGGNERKASDNTASMNTGEMLSVKNGKAVSFGTSSAPSEISGRSEGSIQAFYGDEESQLNSSEEALEPNTLSKVTSSTGEETDEQAAIKHEIPGPQKGQKSWWKLWSWSSSDRLDSSNTTLNSDQSLQEENEEERVFRKSEKEAQRVIDARTSTYEIPSSWAYFQDESEKTGQISIFGTKSMRAPLTVRQNVKCGYDKTDNDEVIPDEEDSSLVVPDFNRNYRDITLQTKARILISSLGGNLIKMFVPGETHLYHESAYDSVKSRKKKAKNGSADDKDSSKRALIIGIHSYLPRQITENLEEGDSVCAGKMVAVASKELGKWADENNLTVKKQTISMDGYGEFFDRVSNCLSLLDNWINAVSSADIVLVVADVQSTAIAIHVLSRLITAGYLENTAYLGFIGLAGVFLGPSLDADAKITIKRSGDSLENKVMVQLFDFQDCQSLQSKELLRHVKILIGRNVKLTLAASLTDTLAPVYSSLCLHVSHPNIFRAIYIDGRSKQPDFIITLVSLALTIKNLNLNDHKLLVELSSMFIAIAWEYRKRKNFAANKRRSHTNAMFTNRYLYRTGIQNMLETSNLMFKQTVQEQEDFDIEEMSTNEYHIPWCMRGFIEELSKLKKKEDRRTDRHFDVDTGQLINQLLEEFRAWQPTQKAYKDFRYCIEELAEMSGKELYGD